MFCASWCLSAFVAKILLFGVYSIIHKLIESDHYQFHNKILSSNVLYDQIDDIDNEEFVESRRSAALQKYLSFNRLALSIEQDVIF
jgi:hypothetical protein